MTTTTDARGEVAFALLVQSADTNIVVQVSAPELAVRPVKFFAIVGTADTPDVPLIWRWLKQQCTLRPVLWPAAY